MPCFYMPPPIRWMEPAHTFYCRLTFFTAGSLFLLPAPPSKALQAIKAFQALQWVVCLTARPSDISSIRGGNDLGDFGRATDPEIDFVNQLIGSTLNRILITRELCRRQTDDWHTSNSRRSHSGKANKKGWFREPPELPNYCPTHVGGTE